MERIRLVILANTTGAPQRRAHAIGAAKKAGAFSTRAVYCEALVCRTFGS